MKANEIKKCLRCGNGVMHTGVPLFWKISVERFGIDLAAVRRHAGMEMLMGSPMLAQVMGLNEDIATPVMEKIEIVLCEKCAMDEQMIPYLAEVAQEQKEKSNA